MRTIELFSGTKSFSKIATKYGWVTSTYDNSPLLEPDFIENILNLPDKLDADIIWASPPCTAFSVASISSHWKGGFRAYVPKSEKAKIGLALLDKTIRIISVSKPKYWFIENPRGVMRKVINRIFTKYGLNPIRHTITYCQYGDTRMKPTDIWTNCKEWHPKPKCKNGAPCHERAPRGSKTGTQGLKGAKERGVIPTALFEEIFDSLPYKSG